jgi:hypothetical protein
MYVPRECINALKHIGEKDFKQLAKKHFVASLWYFLDKIASSIIGHGQKPLQGTRGSLWLLELAVVSG